MFWHATRADWYAGTQVHICLVKKNLIYKSDVIFSILAFPPVTIRPKLSRGQNRV